MDEKVYLNGRLVARGKAKISVSDQGFLYGYGLFQTMRAYHGKLFLLDRHLKRLHEAATVIGIADKIKDIDFVKACNDTLAANRLQEARVRLTVTNGDKPAFPWADKGGKPTVVITAQRYIPFPDEKYSAGFRVGIASVRRVKQSVFSTMKSINYLLNVVARLETAAKGLDEAILLNDAGYVVEGGGSNIFFVKEGELLTPAADSGIIPGVTREVVMKLAAELGIEVTEGNISPGAIKDCDEVFLTNAMIEVMPVTAVTDEKGKTDTIGDGRIGRVTQRLLTAYRERVMRETLNPNI